MSKSFFILCLIILLSFIGYLWYLEYNSYEIATGPQDTVYKLNKRTGETVWIVGSKEQAMIDESIMTPDEKAIKLVTESYVHGYDRTVWGDIQNSLQDKKGELIVHGWRVQTINDNTFLVYYLWEHEGKEYLRIYEAIMNAQIVRFVTSDSTLKNKYIDNIQEEIKSVFN